MKKIQQTPTRRAAPLGPSEGPSTRSHCPEAKPPSTGSSPPRDGDRSQSTGRRASTNPRTPAPTVRSRAALGHGSGGVSQSEMRPPAAVPSRDNPETTRRRPPRWETEVRNAGTIQVGGYAIVRTLLGLAATQSTGVLLLTIADLEVEIYLVSGQVAHVAGAPGDRRLGERLVADVGVDPADLERALRNAQPGCPVGAVASESGLVTGPALRRCVRAQAAARIAGLLGMGPGTWRWVADVAAPQIPTARLAPATMASHVVRDAVASGHAERELARLRSTPCATTTRLTRLAGKLDGTDDWPAVGEPRTIEEALRNLPAADRIRTVFGMLVFGAIDLPDDAPHMAGLEPRRRPSAPAPPRSRVGRPPVAAQTASNRDHTEMAQHPPHAAATGAVPPRRAPEGSRADARQQWQVRLESVQQGLRLDPSDQRLRAERAWIVCNLPHRDPEARDRICLSHLEVATDLEPGMATAWEYLGRLLHRMGRVEDGERALKRAAAIDPWA